MATAIVLPLCEVSGVVIACSFSQLVLPRRMSVSLICAWMPCEGVSVQLSKLTGVRSGVTSARQSGWVERLAALRIRFSVSGATGSGVTKSVS